MKINKLTVTLTHEEFDAFFHIASSVLPVMSKPYDEFDSYFNNEDVFCVSQRDYETAKSIVERLG